MDKPRDTAAESAIAPPEATPEETAQTQSRFGAFVTGRGAESAPTATPDSRLEEWLNRINYQAAVPVAVAIVITHSFLDIPIFSCIEFPENFTGIGDLQ